MAFLDTAAHGSSRRPSRRAAIAGAVLASALILTVAVARNGLDLWLFGAAALAVALSALVARGWEGGPSESRGGVQHGAAAPASAADELLSALPDPVILVDRRAAVLEFNAAAGRLLPALRAGQPLSLTLRSPVVLDGIERAARAGETVRIEYEERVPAERFFEVQMAPLALDGPGQDTVMLVFRDVTAARRVDAMRMDFVANASHELRTPLASLLGFIETLQGSARNDPAARERFLEIMRGQAQRMTRLVDDLLSLSRIEMRAHLPPQGVVDLAAVASDIVAALSPLAREEGVAIELTIPAEPILVQGDRDELLRVTENLVENAVKYGASGGRVEVAVARAAGAPGQVELTVRDYGPGVAAEHLPRLTERFYRVDVAQSRDKGGTGLGLAIVKHIVNRHRGRLSIESEPGAGALVRVTLPEKAESPETAG